MRHSISKQLRNQLFFSYTIAITALTLRHFNESPVNKMTNALLFISEKSKSKIELAKIFERRNFQIKHGKRRAFPEF